MSFVLGIDLARTFAASSGLTRAAVWFHTVDLRRDGLADGSVVQQSHCSAWPPSADVRQRSIAVIATLRPLDNKTQCCSRHPAHAWCWPPEMFGRGRGLGIGRGSSSSGLVAAQPTARRGLRRWLPTFPGRVWSGSVHPCCGSYSQLSTVVSTLFSCPFYQCVQN